MPSRAYRTLTAIEARVEDGRTSRYQLREDVQTLLAMCHDLIWRNTAASMAIHGTLRNTHLGNEVEAHLERERVS